MQKVRWGVIGSGGIANRFAHDGVLMKDAIMYAVASRTKEKAEAFQLKYGFEKSYGSYDELIADPKVDAIYIGVPHPFHKDIAIKCMNAKKAVLCEKPVAVSREDAQEMVSVAKENNVFFMEAMWTRCQMVNRKLHEIIADGTLGKPRFVTANFSFGEFSKSPFEPNHRLVSPTLGGGAILDVGVYVIAFATAVMGMLPTQIKSIITKIDTGVDGMMSCVLGYESGEMAMLQCGLMLGTEHDAKVYFDKGSIELPEFWKCTKATIKYNDPQKQDEFIEDDFIGRGYEGFVYQIQHVMECMDKGLIESPLVTWQGSLNTLQIMDTIRAEHGIKYPFEK